MNLSLDGGPGSRCMGSGGGFCCDWSSRRAPGILGILRPQPRAGRGEARRPEPSQRGPPPPRPTPFIDFKNRLFPVFFTWKLRFFFLILWIDKGLDMASSRSLHLPYLIFSCVRQASLVPPCLFLYGLLPTLTPPLLLKLIYPGFSLYSLYACYLSSLAWASLHSLSSYCILYCISLIFVIYHSLICIIVYYRFYHSFEFW